MNNQTTMVVLANSAKLHGACIAGRLVETAGNDVAWVRPVMDAAGSALPVSRTVCADGHRVEVLDVVSMPLGDAVPQMHQRENRLLGVGSWTRHSALGWSDLAEFAERDGGLWHDGFSSSNGLNDRVPEAFLTNTESSLKLVGCSGVVIHRAIDCFGRSRIRAYFQYAGRNYDLAITDPVAWALYGGNCSYEFADAFLSVSLGQVFSGYAYKLVAAVITPERAGATS